MRKIIPILFVACMSIFLGGITSLSGNDGSSPIKTSISEEDGRRLWERFINAVSRPFIRAETSSESEDQDGDESGTSFREVFGAFLGFCTVVKKYMRDHKGTVALCVGVVAGSALLYKNRRRIGSFLKDKSERVKQWYYVTFFDPKIFLKLIESVRLLEKVRGSKRKALIKNIVSTFEEMQNIDYKDDGGNSLMHHIAQSICNKKVLKELFDEFKNKKVSLPKQISNSNNMLPFHVAIENGNTALVQFLLDTKQASVRTNTSKIGKTPLLIALENKNVGTFKTLLLGYAADPCIPPNQKIKSTHMTRSPPMKSPYVFFKNKQSKSLGFKEREICGFLLIFFIKSDDRERAGFMVKKADLTVRDFEGKTPLHNALVRVVNQKNPKKRKPHYGLSKKIVKNLSLKDKKNVLFWRDDDGCLPCFWAKKTNYADLKNSISPLTFKKKKGEETLDDLPYLSMKFLSILKKALDRAKKGNSTSRFRPILFFDQSKIDRKAVAQVFARQGGFDYLSPEQIDGIKKDFVDEIITKKITITKVFKSAVEQVEKNKKPVVVFLGKIDVAIAKRLIENEKIEPNLSETCRTLQYHLSDNLPQGVIVIASTASRYTLDESVRKKFSIHLPIALPDAHKRKNLLKYHLLDQPKIQLTEKDFDLFTKATRGCTHTIIEDVVTRIKDMLSSSNEVGKKLVTRELLVEAAHHVLKKGEFSDYNLRQKILCGEHIKFRDLVGMNTVINMLKKEVVAPIMDSEKAKKVGAKGVKAFVFDGPPGTGKTTLANALANELDYTFYPVDTPSLISSGLGDTSENIRAVFKKAKNEKKCILFFDEIDVVGGSAPGEGTTQQERKSFITQLFKEVDELKGTDVIFVGATNFANKLDSRIIGRRVKIINVSLPKQNERAKIFAYYINKKPSVDSAVKNQSFYDEIAGKTENWSGSFLEDLVDIAANKSMSEGVVKKKHVLGAFSKLSSAQKSSYQGYLKKRGESKKK